MLYMRTVEYSCPWIWCRSPWIPSLSMVLCTTYPLDPVIRRHGRQSTIERGIFPWLKVQLHTAKCGIENPWISFYLRSASLFISMSRGEMKSQPRFSAAPPKFIKTPSNLYKPTSDGFVSKKKFEKTICS